MRFPPPWEQQVHKGHLVRKLSFVADTVTDTGGKAGFLPRGGQLAAGGAVAESPMHCPQEQSPACGQPLVP